MKQTRNRKPMRPGTMPFVAHWELRVDEMRLYDDVEDEPEAVVLIVAEGRPAAG
jgi:hypothetical protein